MPCVVVAQTNFTVGEETWLAGDSPTAPFGCVFEDDGTTAYFYALELEPEQRILDAVHIYNVANVTDAHRPSKAEIVWSPDGLGSVLLINDYPHAVFDFRHQRAYCRTAFPPPSEWATNDHMWDDAALDLFPADGDV
jgi:hypothetical protein